MNIVITCGPAWEPLDGMRRLTNASTGRLGSILADVFVEAGHRVWVCRADGSTAAPPGRGSTVVGFGTNDDLAVLLRRLATEERIEAVFHAAALCDYRVARIVDTDGRERTEAKIPSRAGRLTVELEPATKVLPELRAWFPSALLCGWKYELVGDRESALAAAWRQREEAGTDACVLNGAAWGSGFAVCEAPGRVTVSPDALHLGAALVEWLGRGRDRAGRDPASSRSPA